MHITKRGLNILLLMLPAFRCSTFPLLIALLKSWISLNVSPTKLSNRILYLMYFLSPLLALVKFQYTELLAIWATLQYQLISRPNNLLARNLILISPLYITSILTGIHSITFFETHLE